MRDENKDFLVFNTHETSLGEKEDDMYRNATHILLIEDESNDVTSIQRVMGDADHEFREFKLTSLDRLSAGLRFIAESNIDIILLDLSLPDSDGFDTFVRVYDFAPDIPIVVLCGLDDKKLGIQAVQNGAQDYLVKGQINGQLLNRVIQYAIERKRTEKQLLDNKEKLRMLNQLKNDFLSTVSHELRTPIAIMREGVSLCLDGVAGGMTDTQKELLNHTLENIDRLATLITDLLDVSELESGKLQLKKSSLDICKIVNEVFECYKSQANEKEVSFIKELPNHPLKLFADRDKIYQIFNHLINNAIRYTHSGGEIRIHAEEKPDVIECSVSDTGIGLAEENIPRLFSKFEQFGREEGPGYKGTGLGLAIVKGLVEKHGGKVWVLSELGKGTTFWFTLKKVPFPTILIVDDEKQVVNSIQKVLCVDNYRFLKAFQGKQAIEITQKETISLLILDLLLPGMSGYEVIGRLKQDDRTNNIPILISSGNKVDQELLDRVNTHGAIPIIEKPVVPVELRHKVRKLLMDA